jgi:hypothetical protein
MVLKDHDIVKDSDKGVQLSLSISEKSLRMLVLLAASCLLGSSSIEHREIAISQYNPKVSVQNRAITNKSTPPCLNEPNRLTKPCRE